MNIMERQAEVMKKSGRGSEYEEASKKAGTIDDLRAEAYMQEMTGPPESGPAQWKSSYSGFPARISL